MAAANRRFARRAKQPFNPFKHSQTTHPSAESASQATKAPVMNTSPANLVRDTIATPATANPSEHRTPNTERRYYVLRRRVGKKTYSTYVSAKSGAADMAFIDSIYRQAALDNRRLANALILKLKTLHMENELAYKATDAEVSSALTAAGYHRHNRGPWRKMRLSPPVTAIPNTQYPIPVRVQNCLPSLAPLLKARVEVCRNHAVAISELYESTPIRARSKTAARIYARYSKRATDKLAAAEKSLDIVKSLAKR